MIKNGPSELEMEAVEIFTAINLTYGTDPTVARIASFLYISPGELSMDDLKAKTGYSAATISNKTQGLVKIGAIKRRSHPGTKKAFFYMEKNIKKIHCEMLRKSIDLKILPLKEKLPKLIKKYEATKNSEDDSKRMGIMKDLLKQINFLEQHLSTVLKKIENMSEVGQ